MTKHITSRFWSCLVVSLAFSPVFAQAGKQAIPASFTSPHLTSVAQNTYVASPSAMVNTKVQRSFLRLFQGAVSPHWRTDAQRFVVEFKVGDRLAQASFGKKGHVFYAILYGTGQHLSAAEREMVESAYPDYDIPFTQEVTIDGLKLWIVSLENRKNLIKVGLMDGHLYTLEHIERTK